MLGRFVVPVAQPIEQAVLSDAVPMQEAVIGWVDAEPVYDQAAFFSTSTEGGWDGWMVRGPGQLLSQAQAVGQRIEGGRSILMRSISDGSVFRWGVGIDSTASAQLTKLFMPVMRLR
jgi:hypothetical protein